MNGKPHLIRPRLDVALEAAMKTLLKRSGDDLPVRPTEIEELFGVEFLDARMMARALGPKLYYFDAAVCRMDGAYKCFLNVRCRNASRILFTLMHEAGHIACGHFEEFDLDPILDETHPAHRAITDALDREADWFAAEVLMPLPIIATADMTEDEIREHFRVSKKAAARRAREISARADNPVYKKYANRILEKYSEFVESVRGTRLMRESGVYEYFFGKDGEKHAQPTSPPR